ncbi:hypothetical protein K1719_013758 [Acacia pycnantha]|nr:hypothetical protein K1719_013758 [Acacia pycnantha]
MVDEVGIYGRNEDKEIMIKWLLNDSHFSVTSIMGSRILVTSGDESVASTAPSDETYRPHQLSDDDGWLLFTKYAFRNSRPQTNSDLEEIGRRVVKKCKGLPLALKTIVCPLYRKSSWEE